MGVLTGPNQYMQEKQQQQQQHAREAEAQLEYPSLHRPWSGFGQMPAISSTAYHSNPKDPQAAMEHTDPQALAALIQQQLDVINGEIQLIQSDFMVPFFENVLLHSPKGQVLSWTVYRATTDIVSLPFSDVVLSFVVSHRVLTKACSNSVSAGLHFWLNQEEKKNTDQRAQELRTRVVNTDLSCGFGDSGVQMGSWSPTPPAPSHRAWLPRQQKPQAAVSAYEHNTVVQTSGARHSQHLSQYHVDAEYSSPFGDFRVRNSVLMPELCRFRRCIEFKIIRKPRSWMLVWDTNEHDCVPFTTENPAKDRPPENVIDAYPSSAPPALPKRKQAVSLAASTKHGYLPDEVQPRPGGVSDWSREAVMSIASRPAQMTTQKMSSLPPRGRSNSQGEANLGSMCNQLSYPPKKMTVTDVTGGMHNDEER
ncbi:unnamed protein product [Schistocephalus solidus]|uniref:Nucleoporin NUP53 n=1 Tax=Schistocephalus solidus TaxID=70667 RepID=A0A183SUB6_SCHSO|nr:unnamed protein product [Schistocephalus solidus]